MEERLICALFIIPSFIFCCFEFENKKAEKILRVVSGVFLIFLAWYLGVVLPQ